MPSDQAWIEIPDDPEARAALAFMLGFAQEYRAWGRRGWALVEIAHERCAGE